MRRPSPALAVALLALFVALGGPAEAKKLLIGSKQIKDGSIRAKDLGGSLIKGLRATPDKSITSAKIADGTIKADDLATGAVTAPKLAGFAGSAKVTFAALPSGCTGGTTDKLTPLIAGADLGKDVIVVTPPGDFPGGVSVTARPAGPDTFSVTACGPAAPGGDFTLRYAAIDVA